jgi:putative sigma-54 modulation protein
MTIEFTGRQTEVPPQIRSLAERKLGKLGKVLRGITHAHLILTSDKHRQIAEVSVHSRHLDLTAAEESGDLAVSVSSVLDKLIRQAQRHQGKRQERKRRPRPGRATSAWSGVVAEGSDGERGPRVIRSRLFTVKPMTVEEAVIEVGAAADGLLVFRDASTEKVSVLYRRKDGNLGLIEPEA